MVRTVERLDGLALLGRASVGPLSLEVPALVTAGPEGGVEELRVEERPGAIGERRLGLGRSDIRIELTFPVLAPEVAGTERGVHPIGPSAYLLHVPFDRDAARALRAARPELVVLGNARVLWNEGRPFVAAMRDVRSAVGAAPLLWAPRVALPHRVAFLAYLGVDLVDTTEGALRTLDGEFLDLTLGSATPESVRRERACDCAACSVDPPGPLAVHTDALYRRAIAETRAAIRRGQLRELVEARLGAEPALAEMLRYADADLAGPIEERASLLGAGSRAYVYAEAHRRPEMARFRARLLERYRPPPSKSVMLVVPCSKTKPYRRSRSHRRFFSALEGLPGLERVHLVSVSSPIGAVPQELEDVPPARQYDIPVTGAWTEPERAVVRAGIGHLRRAGAYRSTVVHLDPDEYRFLAEELPEGPDVRWTIADGRTTSAEALASLRRAVEDSLAETRPVAGGPLAVVREELRELASVQFGRATADRLFSSPIRLAGRPWFQRLTDGHVDLATVREERGLFHLTVAGARKIGAPYPLAIEVDPKLPLTGDLFVPGVRAADPEIRVGDSVVLLRDGALAAVGEALLPGPLLGELERGLAVRVRHREHARTDSPISEEASPTDGGPVVQR